ncbi:aspartate/glutamate racemase family protein [Streptomyces vietnamensis]|uniref:aspartate/glutamate racemase family protein n=1 Tax=Streptomyces vietnamensis TaxID=362257 RepID=UPI00059AB2F5|nr:aspartate/glutamate racemase family protein [Streptomyces vietnamensis]
MVLVNPNTSTATTAMMTAIARRTLGPALPVRGVTVARGPRMLTDPDALRAAAPEVLAAGLRATTGGDCAALLVAAFGDPGLAELRAATSTTSTTSTTRATSTAGAAGVRAAGFPVVGATGVPAAGAPVAGIPVVGIGEAALLEAAAAGTPFGVATTTPLLADAIHARVTALGLADLYTGIRLTAGTPERLSADPVLLLDRLERAVRASAERDGARAVVIGGGPLGEAAEELQARCAVRVVAPIPAACRAIARLLTA